MHQTWKHQMLKLCWKQLILYIKFLQKNQLWVQKMYQNKLPVTLIFKISHRSTPFPYAEKGALLQHPTLQGCHYHNKVVLQLLNNYPCYFFQFENLAWSPCNLDVKGHVVTGKWITTIFIVQTKLLSFGLIAKYCSKTWALGINVLCIIVSNIWDLYPMQGREGQERNNSHRTQETFVIVCPVVLAKTST